MSGPITAGYAIVYGSVILAQHAIREAHAMKREYGDVVAQLRAREEEIAQNRAAQQAARVERLHLLRRAADRQQARIERLRALAGDGAAPAIAAAPAEDDDAAWSAYLQALEREAAALEKGFEAASGDAAERLRAALSADSGARDIDRVLAAYALQRRANAKLGEEDSVRFRDTAARVLGRLDLEEGTAVPVALEALAREIVLAPTVERAEALASELRLAVQRHRDARIAQRAEREEAQRLLAEMPEDAPVPLLRAIERVAAGVERMDASLRRSAHDVLDTAAADRADAEQRAAAYVLEESLRDLGYEVEDIDATLFVGGGIAHFRRPGWDDYYVRLRVDAREHTVNFNVVRARGAEDTAERRRLDALAEDRWCAEFPRLMETLHARGLTLDVTRRLEAGQVPVQIVDGATLPPLHAESDDARPRRSPFARRAP
jgi:hypothetical protein